MERAFLIGENGGRMPLRCEIIRGAEGSKERIGYPSWADLHSAFFLSEEKERDHALESWDRLAKSPVSAEGDVLQQVIRASRFLSEMEPQASDSKKPGVRYRELKLGGRTSPKSVFRKVSDANGYFLGKNIPLSGKTDYHDEMRAISEKVSETWLTDEYLGRIVGRRFHSMPPILVALASRCNAVHLGGTNIIGVPEPIIEEDKARIPAIIAHEQLHYAAELGGGGPYDSTWRIKASFFEPRGWLHEGFTEMMANQLALSRNLDVPACNYAIELSVASIIQKISGGEKSRKAYLSGDFTGVGESVDGKLGAGTLRKMISSESPKEAFEFLIERCWIAGIDPGPRMEYAAEINK